MDWCIRFKYSPDYIYNLYKTVDILRIRKQIGQTTSNERGTLITALCCVDVVGQSLPSALISPRLNFKQFMLNGVRSGSLGLATSSVWMNSSIFPKYLMHFIKYIKCSKASPAVLMMDNHESHI